MRKGELMGLRWSDIDLNEKYFDINSTRGDYGENKPKTKTSIRKVYFDNSLLEIYLSNNQELRICFACYVKKQKFKT